MCQPGMGRGRRCMGYSAAGSVMAPGRGSSPGCRRPRMRPGRSAGRSASIPRCAGRISMRLVPGGRGTGSVSRRAGRARLSLGIMGWAARAGACPPRSIWRVSSGRSRWRSSSPPGSAVTARSSRPCRNASGCPGPGGAVPAPGRGGCWLIRPAVPGLTAATCGGGGSGAPSRTRPTRSATGRTRAAPAAARPRSTPNCTSNATPSRRASRSAVIAAACRHYCCLLPQRW